MKEKVIEILKDIIADFNPEETALVDGEIMSSLDILNLLAELGDEFDISIPPTEITAENFNNVDAIVAMLERLI